MSSVNPYVGPVRERISAPRVGLERWSFWTHCLIFPKNSRVFSKTSLLSSSSVGQSPPIFSEKLPHREIFQRFCFTGAVGGESQRRRRGAAFGPGGGEGLVFRRRIKARASAQQRR